LLIFLIFIKAIQEVYAVQQVSGSLPEELGKSRKKTGKINSNPYSDSGSLFRSGV
jgi:hypothetical protein